MKLSEFKPASGRWGGVQVEGDGYDSFVAPTFLDPVWAGSLRGFPLPHCVRTPLRTS